MVRYRRLFFPVFLVLSLFLIAPAAHGFSDLEGHWAEKTVRDLVRLRSSTLSDRPSARTRVSPGRNWRNPCRHF